MVVLPTTGESIIIYYAYIVTLCVLFQEFLTSVEIYDIHHSFHLLPNTNTSK